MDFFDDEFSEEEQLEQTPLPLNMDTFIWSLLAFSLSFAAGVSN